MLSERGDLVWIVSSSDLLSRNLLQKQMIHRTVKFAQKQIKKELVRRAWTAMEKHCTQANWGAFINKTKCDQLILVCLGHLGFNIESPTFQKIPQTWVNRDGWSPYSEILHYSLFGKHCFPEVITATSAYISLANAHLMDTPGFNKVEITKSFYWEQQN